MWTDSGSASTGNLVPVRDGPFVQTEGRNDGLDGTAMSQQGDDSHDQLLFVVQPIKGRALGFGEHPATFAALIALVLAAMNDDVALARLTCGRTIRAGAECCVRVH